VDGASTAASPASPARSATPPAASAAAGSSARLSANAGTATATPASPSTATTSKSASRRSTASSRGRARAADVASGSLRLYSDTQGRYTINIPDGWTLTSEKGFPSLRNGEAWIQLRDEPAVDAKAAASAAMASLNGQFPSFQPVNIGEETLGDRAGYSMTLNAVSKAGRKSALMIVTAPEGRGQYVAVVGGASAEDAGTVASGVGAVAKSLWFKSR
jgi:hypothetical protein